MLILQSSRAFLLLNDLLISLVACYIVTQSEAKSLPIYELSRINIVEILQSSRAFLPLNDLLISLVACYIVTQSEAKSLPIYESSRITIVQILQSSPEISGSSFWMTC